MISENFRLSIVIPCLNEAGTIQKVIAEALSGLKGAGIAGEVLVADNGSKDGSQDLARSSGARVIDVLNRGYGSALHTGIMGCSSPWVLFGDADMSYDFGQVCNFSPMMNADFDLVLGSRLSGTIESGAMPFLNRYLGTPALNCAIRIFFGLHTSDCNSGMRLLRRSFYQSIPMRAPGMEWASELLIKAHLSGARYGEVPIGFRRDQRGRPPHLRRWYDGWRHLKTIVLLSPNRMIGFPALLACGVAVELALSSRHILAFAAMIFSATGLLLWLIVKLVMHVDKVRFSALIARLLRAPTAEWMLAIGVLAFCGGLQPWVVGNPPLEGNRLFFFFLTVCGSLTILASFFWGTIITHCLRKLRGDGD